MTETLLFIAHTPHGDRLHLTSDKKGTFCGHPAEPTRPYWKCSDEEWIEAKDHWLCAPNLCINCKITAQP